MSIDMPTLMIAGSFVAAISGMFLIFAWMQNRGASGMLWWAGANLLLAVCIPLIAFPDATPGTPSVVLAMVLLNISPALIWAAARACNNRRVDLGIVGSGAVIWLLAFLLPAIRSAPNAQLALNLAIVSFFILAAAHEFWRARADRLTARWPLIVLLVLHGLFSAVGAADAALGGPLGTATLQIWFGFVHFETLAFVVGTSIFTVAMARERNELLQRIAANTDSLTGLSTRRAFYEDAERVLAACRESHTSVTVVLFDLDAFKSINDTFGHGPGDEVLRTFGQTAKKALRGSDLIGRLGGEEFAAILPGASADAAYVVAERIRVAFTAACRAIVAIKVDATVSAGIATADAFSTVDSMIRSADTALYRAKSRGRDRVEVVTGEPPGPIVPAMPARQVA